MYFTSDSGPHLTLDSQWGELETCWFYILALSPTNLHLRGFGLKQSEFKHNRLTRALEPEPMNGSGSG